MVPPYSYYRLPVNAGPAKVEARKGGWRRKRGPAAVAREGRAYRTPCRYHRPQEPRSPFLTRSSAMCRHLFPLGTLACVLTCLPAAAPAAEVVDVVSPRAFPKAQQPQAAVSPSGKVFLVFGAGNAVYCTASDDGKSYGEPVKVGEVGALALGMRRGPRVAATDKAVVVIAVGGKEGRGRDEGLLAWRSGDGGKSWQGPVAVNSVAGSAREGLHQTAAAPDGTVYCAWLDLRENKTQVYGAASADGGATWQGERLVYASPDGSVCECCQPQAAYDPKGRLHVMW